jgi:Toprim domain
MIAADLLAEIDGRVGVFDLPCPECGPSRRAMTNQRRKVLRVWHGADAFLSWHCARCGETGFQKGHRRVASIDRAQFAKAQRELANRTAVERQGRLDKALWLWRSRQPIRGSVAEVYLREVRAYPGPLPATLGFLPARGEHPPAMIAAFGIPTEPEPGILYIIDEQVRGVHLTRLKPDGSGKAGNPSKIMIGHSIGLPIVLAPMNDMLGLAIAEGIEDALTVHQATGLGSWAAGAASRMPALAEAVPGWTDCVTILVDDDDAGRKHANAMAARIAERGIAVEMRGATR